MHCSFFLHILYAGIIEQFVVALQLLISYFYADKLSIHVYAYFLHQVWKTKLYIGLAFVRCKLIIALWCMILAFANISWCCHFELCLSCFLLTFVTALCLVVALDRPRSILSWAGCAVHWALFFFSSLHCCFGCCMLCSCTMLLLSYFI